MRNHWFLFYLIIVIPTSANAQIPADLKKPAVGVCVSDSQADQAKDGGFDFILPSVASYLKPDLSDVEFSTQLPKKHTLPVFACNGFFPSQMKCVGPNSHLDSLLIYAETVFRRAKLTDVPIIVFGSGGARTIPEGFDREIAEQQFIELCKGLAELAGQYNIKIALENLNKEETNLINTVEEAIAVCKKVNKPNFGVNVDIYHMLKESESPNNILQAQDYILICDIAERAKRTPPGVDGTDFSPYLRMLNQIDYHGGIAVEARWDDFSKQAPLASQTLNEQLEAIY